MLRYFKTGHYTDRTNGTGCTVIFPPEGTVASASVRGASPGTRELALLAPERKLNTISALVLTGGSAFGLNAVHGVVEYLESRNMGYKTAFGVVPIIPAAVIYDLNFGKGSVRPTAENAKEAAETARYDNYDSGNVGAGTGATVGKWSGISHAMKGGLGLSQNEHSKVKVLALTVVNAVGDIIGYDGKILAGALTDTLAFRAEKDHKTRWGDPEVGMAENTVLNVIMTNAVLTKQQAYYVADRAHYGIARRIDPSHTSYDGDISFVLSVPEREAPLDLVAAMATKSTEESILEAVYRAEDLAGVKSLRGMQSVPGRNG